MANSVEFKYSLENIKLEDLTTISLSTDTLRLNFEIILHTLKNLNKKLDSNINEVKETNNEYNKQILQLNERIQLLEIKEVEDKKNMDIRLNEMEVQNSNVFEKIKEMNNIVDNVKLDIQNTKEDIINLKENMKYLTDQNMNNRFTTSDQNMNIINKRLEEYEKSIQDLLNKFNNVSNKENEGGNEIVNVTNMEEIMRLLDSYANKKELDDLKSNTDLMLRRHQESMEDIYKMLEDLKVKTSNKVDCDNYDEHMDDYNRMKMILMNMINSHLGDADQKIDFMNQLGTKESGLSSKDANLLKEISIKFPEIEQLLKKLQKDINDEVHQHKIFVDETNKKTCYLDDNVKRLRDEMKKRFQNLEDLSKSSLLNTDKIDQRGGGNAINNKDSKRRPSNLITDSNDFNNTIKKLQSQLLIILDNDKEQDVKLEKLFNEVSEIKQIKIKLKNLMESYNENRSKIISIEEELSELKILRERIENLEATQIKETKKTKKGGDDINQNVFGINLEEAKKLIGEAIDGLREELLKLIEELRSLITKKVDSEDLWKSELLEKLDQVVGGLLKKFADKADTKKAFLFLEKKIKDISLLIFGDPSLGEEGAMFAKKPWTSWNCASCDSKLQKYPGALIDHKNWNKFPPNETSPEKITQGKFGKGWGKWADKHKSQDKLRETTTKDQFFRTTGDSLPHIPKQTNNAKEELSTKSSAK